MRPITLIDSSLSAAQVATWGGRATDAMLLPILARMGRAGFAAIDIMDPDVHRAAAETLMEHPWRRIAEARRAAPGAPLNAWLNTRTGFGAAPLMDGVFDLALRRLAALGVARVTLFDPMNDEKALLAALDAAWAAGLRATLVVAYAPAGALPATYFADKAHVLAAKDVESICLWDSAGVLDAVTARNLIPALRKAVGDKSLELRGHCRSGLAEIVYLEAARAGVDALHTALEPLAGGVSLPSAGYVADHLAREGVAVGVDAAELGPLADYFTAIAERHDFPVGAHRLRDFESLEHQLPGPALEEARASAADAGPKMTVEAVLAEVARVREDLGSPSMLGPVGSAAVRQAVLNLSGKRYATVDPGIAQVLAGALGAPPLPVDSDLAARAAAKPAKKSAAAKDLKALRAAFKSPSDDDLLLAAMAGAEAPAAIRAHEGKVDAWVAADTPFDQLKAEIARRPWIARLSVRKGAFTFETGADGAAPKPDTQNR